MLLKSSSCFIIFQNKAKCTRLEFLISAKILVDGRGCSFTRRQVVVLIVLKIRLSWQKAERFEHEKREMLGNLGE